MIKNRRRLFVALLIVMIFVLTISFGAQNEDALSDVCFVVKGSVHEEEIHLFKNNSIYYAFLPSYAELNQITIVDRFGRNQRLYLDEKCCMTMPDCGSLLFDQPYKLEIRGLAGTVIDEGTLILKKSDNIAAFSVRLIDGTIADLHDSKTNQKTGTLTVTKADGTVDFSGTFRSIGGRGNTTWGQSKKPYSLKFDADTVLLGMGATKGYNLLANACDESNLRNL